MVAASLVAAAVAPAAVASSTAATASTCVSMAAWSVPTDGPFVGGTQGDENNDRSWFLLHHFVNVEPRDARTTVVPSDNSQNFPGVSPSNFSSPCLRSTMFF